MPLQLSAPTESVESWARDWRVSLDVVAPMETNPTSAKAGSPRNLSNSGRKDTATPTFTPDDKWELSWKATPPSPFDTTTPLKNYTPWSWPNGESWPTLDPSLNPSADLTDILLPLPPLTLHRSLPQLFHPPGWTPLNPNLLTAPVKKPRKDYGPKTRRSLRLKDVEQNLGPLHFDLKDLPRHAIVVREYGVPTMAFVSRGE